MGRQAVSQKRSTMTPGAELQSRVCRECGASTPISALQHIARHCQPAATTEFQGRLASAQATEKGALLRASWSPLAHPFKGWGLQTAAKDADGFQSTQNDARGNGPADASSRARSDVTGQREKTRKHAQSKWQANERGAPHETAQPPAKRRTQPTPLVQNADQPAVPPQNLQPLRAKPLRAWNDSGCQPPTVR